LADVERFAHRDVAAGVYESNRTDARALRQAMRDGAADGAGPEDGDEGHGDIL
jgi:hypothetical protein